MKHHLYKILSVTCAGLWLLSSCSKDQNVIYDGGTAPVLSASVTDSIPLPITDSTANAVTFNWTNPAYTFSTGVSSLDVTYYLEFDTVGANFTSPTMQTVAISSSVSETMTVSFLNNLCTNGMGLTTTSTHQIQVRVESFLQPNSPGSPIETPLISTPLNFTVAPWSPPPVVAPPASGTLYIVGSAIAANNWANPIAPSTIASQTFTQLSPTHYTLQCTLTGGGEYKLISVNGSWTDQWSVATADTYPNGGPFIFNGNNCIAPASTGTYTIDVNFQTGIFTVTAS